MKTENLSPEVRAEIDNTSLFELLRQNRYGCHKGDPRFQGAEGAYRIERLRKLALEDPKGYARAERLIKPCKI